MSDEEKKPEGWLWRILENAEREVRSWPAGMRREQETNQDHFVDANEKVGR